MKPYRLRYCLDFMDTECVYLHELCQHKEMIHSDFWGPDSIGSKYEPITRVEWFFRALRGD